MFLAIEEAERRRREEAKRILGHSSSYFCCSIQKAKDELDYAIFLNSKDKKDPVLVFEDSSFVLDFPFFVYDDQRTNQSNKKIIKPGYFFIGSANRPSDFERSLFKLDRIGRETMFDLMIEFHKHKLQRTLERTLAISNPAVEELKKAIGVANGYIDSTIKFKGNSKRAKSTYHFIERSGNRLNVQKRKIKKWEVNDTSRKAQYTKAETEELIRFYLEQISFGQAILNATEERREKFQELIKGNFLYERLCRISFNAYEAIIREENGKRGNDSMILAEAIFSALFDPLSVSSSLEGRVGLISKDHHFQEIAKRIEAWKKLFYNSNIQRTLEGKKLNLTLYQYAPYLSQNTTQYSLDKQKLMRPVGRIFLRKEGRNLLLNYEDFTVKRG